MKISLQKDIPDANPAAGTNISAKKSSRGMGIFAKREVLASSDFIAGEAQKVSSFDELLRVSLSVLNQNHERRSDWRYRNDGSKLKLFVDHFHPSLEILGLKTSAREEDENASSEEFSMSSMLSPADLKVEAALQETLYPFFDCEVIVRAFLPEGHFYQRRRQ